MGDQGAARGFDAAVPGRQLPGATARRRSRSRSWRCARPTAAARRAAPKEALKGIDLAVPRGAIFGLLGPNGAGKSTLINILAGLVIKTAGSARIWGFDIDVNPRRARRAIGVVPQELNLDAFFTPREVLDIQAGLYGVPQARAARSTRSSPRSASPTRRTPTPARSRAACGGACWSPRR